MKRLHKKIGVGVLVAGLVLGGVGLSKGSVAHADDNIEEQYKNKLIGNLNAEQQSVFRIVNGLGSSRGKFYIVDVSKDEKSLNLDRGSIKHEISLSRDKLEDLKDILEKESKNSFVKLKFEDVKLGILIVILK